MRLASISLLGFKSFADRVELDFMSGINAIVGPNGSGKSNVVDALRWVTGGGRASAYRAEERVDLIFHGAEGKRGLNLAEVALRLEGAGRTLQLSRSLFRDGQGKLLLGGKPARLLDVEDALAGSGLGRGGLSVIGQGEVGGVLIADPARLLGYVEEAAGVSRLSGRREQTLARLGATEDHLKRLDDLLLELARSVAKLKGEADAAERAQRLSARALKLRYTLAWRRVHGLKAEVATLRAEGETLASAQASGKAEADAAQGAWMAARRRLEEEEMRYREVVLRTEAAKGELRLAQARAQSLLERRVTLARAAAHLEREHAQLEELQAPHPPGKPIEALCAALKAAERAEQTARTELERRQTVQRGTQAALSALQQEFASARAAATVFETRRAQLEADREAARGRLAELAAEQEASDLGALAAEHAAQRDRLNALRGALEAAREETAALQGEHTRLHAQAHALARSAARARAAHRARQGYAEGPRQALQANIPGVIGSVADLIGVPSEYALAVSSALGRRAEHVVVDTAQTAQRVLDHLRHAGGRVTLLPLDLIEDRAEGGQGGAWPELQGMPGYLGPLRALVRFDSRYAAVIGQLLGNTALVETLLGGVALARRFKRRPRLVTLGGDLIEAYGAMTGGRAQSAGAQLIGALAELEASEREAAEAEATASRLDAQVRSAQVTLRERTAALTAARGDVSALEARLAARRERQAGHATLQRDLTARLHKAETELAALTPPQTRASASDQAALEAALDDAQRSLEAAQGAAVDAQATRSQAQEALAVYRERWHRYHEDKARFEAAQARVAALREELVALEGEQTGLEAALVDAQAALHGAQSALPPALGHDEEALAAVKREAQRAEARLGELNAAQAQLAGTLEANALARARRETSLEAAEEELRGFPGGLEPLEGSLKSLRDELAETQATLEAIGPVNHRAALEHGEQQQRLDDLSVQAAEARAAALELSGVLEAIDREVSHRLESAVTEVRGLFSQYSHKLFGGGEADIVVEREEGRPSGLRISLQPPGKTTRSLSLLSVGERTMGAMAFLFALMASAKTGAALAADAQPSETKQGLSVAILDEVDAPLDEANIRRFCGFVETLAKGGTQFILVTHQKATMEVADALWGVTTERGVSRVFSISKDDTLARAAG